MSGRICSVVGCSNSKWKDPSIVLYNFPRKSYEKGRLERWITAIRRVCSDGRPWQPSKKAAVCSKHFVSGKKSPDQSNIDYVPTIFPDCYRKRFRNTTAILNRAKRHESRVANVDIAVPSSTDENKESAMILDDQEPVAKSIGTQYRNSVPDDQFIFVCERAMGNEVGCQAQVEGLFVKPTKDQATCIDAAEESMPTSFLDCKGFHGISSIDKSNGRISRDLQSVCGVTWETFKLLGDLISETGGNNSYSRENRLCIFLMKMKLGLTFTALGVLWGLHRVTISRMFKQILTTLAGKTNDWLIWPSVFTVQNTLPLPFRLFYPNARVIIDCTEIRTEQPPSLEKRLHQYSYYKSGYTVKFLLGITPDGFISFKSMVYGGRTSDCKIVSLCGILDLLEPGDMIMADKGFPSIQSGPTYTIVVPPRLENGKLTAEQVEATRSIASVRIHVERVIGRIKIFNILKFIPIHLLPYIEEIVHMACVLTNLHYPDLNDDY